MADSLTPEMDAAWPALSERQVGRIAALALERAFADGETLWNAGDRDRPLFVILDGEVEILLGVDHVVTVDRKGAFTGDVDLLSGRPVVARGRAVGSTRVLELPATRLRALVQTDAELGEVFLRTFMLRRAGLVAQGGRNLVLIGSSWCSHTTEIDGFLTRNSQPHAFLDVERDPAVQETLDRLEVTIDDIPVVICRDTLVLRKPTIEQVAECLGLRDLKDTVVRDLVVVGAGPAGLSAAVYAASEGLDVLVLESHAPGGQSGASMRIENYLGFPSGVTGEELARLARAQAEKFGAEMAVARTVTTLECDRPYRVHLGPDTVVQTRAVVIATGVRYRKPDIANLQRFEGQGVYYAATPVEGRLCGGDEVVIVGGGNSAGQAAVYLSGVARRVTIMVRGDGLASSMSRYLIRRIEQTPNIRLLTRTQIVELEGGAGLERVTWRGPEGATTSNLRHVFLMTGADANTAWLRGCVALDDKGFVKTGPDLDAAALSATGWTLQRQPLLFETSRPGVFAVGDVRANSVKRVAAAVGEGAICVLLAHRVLGEAP